MTELATNLCFAASLALVVGDNQRCVNREHDIGIVEFAQDIGGASAQDAGRNSAAGFFSASRQPSSLSAGSTPGGKCSCTAVRNVPVPSGIS